MTTTPTEPDHAIVSALLGNTDLRERTAAMTAEVERAVAETRELRLRGHALLHECGEFEKQLGPRIQSVIDQCDTTITPKMDLQEGILQVVGALLGTTALSSALYVLGDMFQEAAENSNYTEDADQEVAS